MPLLGFYISFDLPSLFIFRELVFLLFYCYCYQDCIISWLVINSCQPTSTNSNQLSWWLHFSLLFYFILVRHMSHLSWHHDCFSYLCTSPDMMYVVWIVGCTYCVWYSWCSFDHTVQYHWICLLQIFFLTTNPQNNVYF